MNGLQIIQCIDEIPCLKQIFIGVYNNKTVPMTLKNIRNGFYIINTANNVNKMGHWVMYYVKDFTMYFFDSFGCSPSEYGLDIAKIYNLYRFKKHVVFNREIQDESSYVCGLYTLYFAYLMCNNKTIEFINKKFGKNRSKNDLFVINYINKLLGLRFTCKKVFCSSLMYSYKCRNYCVC